MMTTTRIRKLGGLSWKAGFFLAAAIAVVELMPSPVPARQGMVAPASAEAAPKPRFDMVETTKAESAPTAPSPAPAAQPAPPAGGPVAVADYPLKAELPVGRMLEPGEWAWTQGEVPTAGEALIVVNLRAQLLSLYRDGYEVGRARIIYGADEKPTPTGTFPILAKAAVHFSNIYGGAPMPHTLRLTNDGVSIHGSEIADDLVTHGCVGLPKQFAAMLFRQVKVGDRVVIWRG